MPSKYEATLRELAMEPDEAKRLEMAAGIDRDAAELDERYDNRDAYRDMEAQRDAEAAEKDAAIAQRDEWKKRYADRFFGADGAGGVTPSSVIGAHEDDVRKESRKRGFAALWDDRKN